mmetsp:Transcript_53466/g.159979  ORF Transcript_53466/g.159979 Transcript_53466/m.159979 type:complete len:422 (+) Transcript_53466:546-1811(+)
MEVDNISRFREKRGSPGRAVSPPTRLVALDLIVRPLEPGHESLDVFLLHGRTAPDPDGGGRVAISSNVQRDLLIVEEGDELLDLIGIEIERQTDGRGRSRRLILGEEIDPIVLGHERFDGGEVILGPLHESRLAPHGIGPLQRVDVILHGDHGGSIDGGALEYSRLDLALLGESKDLGEGTVLGGVGFEAFDGAGTENEHSVGALSPQHLLPRVGGDVELVPGHIHGEACRGGVAHGQSGPIVRDEIGPVRDAHARGRAIEGETNVVVAAGLGQIGKLAVVGRVLGDVDGVPQFQVGDGVGEPSLAEGFPVADVDVAGAEHVPHGHLVRARVGGGDDADEIIVGHSEDALRLGDGQREAFLAELGAVGPAEDAQVEVGHVVARALLARTRGELDVLGLAVRGGVVWREGERGLPACVPLTN